MRRAFVDRNRWLGDPDFVDMPIERLLSKSYAARLRAQILPDRATPPNGGFGSAVTVTGAGFLLNNEMDDFTTAPGKPNMYGLVQGDANAIRPRKRMLSAMTPSIVLDRDGKLFMVLG